MVQYNAHCALHSTIKHHCLQPVMFGFIFSSTVQDKPEAVQAVVFLAAQIGQAGM
jgi:hypothetical protein